MIETQTLPNTVDSPPAATPPALSNGELVHTRYGISIYVDESSDELRVIIENGTITGLAEVPGQLIVTYAKPYALPPLRMLIAGTNNLGTNALKFG
jgi:hypothetical protein